MPVIPNIELLKNTKELTSGLFLCLIGTDKIPPHIAIIANGKYYSASVRGVKLGVNYKGLLKILETKQTATLFLKIDELIDQKKLREVYQNYPKLTINESCLFPIRDYFKLNNWKVHNWNFVFDLVNDLLKGNKIEVAYHLKMEELLDNNSFKLKEYTKEDIVALIKKLKALC